MMTDPLHDSLHDSFSTTTPSPAKETFPKPTSVPDTTQTLPFEPAVHEAIQRLVRRLTRTGFLRRDAEDLRQELILIWLRRRASYDPTKGSLGAYAQTVLRRAAVDLRRRRQAACRDPHRILPLDGEELPDSTAFLEREQMRLDAEHFLALLPAEHAQLLLAWARDDLAQLADQRGLRPATLHQRARKLLGEIQARLLSTDGSVA